MMIRLSIVLLSLLLFATSSNSDETKQCAAILEDAKRLLCYDLVLQAKKEPPSAAENGKWPSELKRGAPFRLVGDWGNGPWQCAGAHRSGGYENLWSISETEYSVCGGSMCGGAFLRHRQISENTYRLDSVAGLENTRSKYVIKFIRDNIIETKSSYDNFKEISTYVRCNKRHALRAIGLSTSELFGKDGGANRQSNSVIYSVVYAVLSVKKCADFLIESKVFNQFIEAANIVLREQRNKKILKDRSYNWSSPSEWIKFRTQYAIENATKDINVDFEILEKNDFCEAVYQAYGPSGSILPKLVNDQNRREG